MADNGTTFPNLNESSVNSTTNVTFTRNEDLARVEVIVQSVIFVLAVLGNTTVLLSLYRKRKSLTRMHHLMMHLSLADLFVAFGSVLPQLAWDITYVFKGGDILCRLVKYMQIVAIYASAYVLVMTAIDRYCAICLPFISHQWSNKMVRKMVIVAWTLSLVLSVPQLFIFSYKLNAYGMYDCWGTFHPAWTLTFYITTFTVLVYIIPAIILVFCYSSICFVVWRSSRNAERLGALARPNRLLSRENIAHDEFGSSIELRSRCNSTDNRDSYKHLLCKVHSVPGDNGTSSSCIRNSGKLCDDGNNHKSMAVKYTFVGEQPRTVICKCNGENVHCNISGKGGNRNISGDMGHRCNANGNRDHLHVNGNMENGNHGSISDKTNNMLSVNYGNNVSANGDSTKTTAHSAHNTPRKMFSHSQGRSPARVLERRSTGNHGISRAKMRTIKLTLAVVICYLACWSPFFIAQMWAVYDPTAPFYGAPYTIILLLASLNSCTNPWIYLLFSESFLSEVKQTSVVLTRVIRCQKAV